jgi:hypothetical protein
VGTRVGRRPGRRRGRSCAPSGVLPHRTKHRLPVIFNCFAFVRTPGEADPCFDPAALDGQRAFLGAIARAQRFAREFVWD